ncbi:MAG: hypothetical protein V1740_02085 [Candidatus Woesearchaeota archaeon]
MREKRGSSQVDWAVSLALFLLYISWFFLFVRPSSGPVLTSELFLSTIERNIEDISEWSFKRTPIFIKSSFDAKKFPVFVKTTGEFEKNKFAFDDNRPYDLLDKRIFFFSDLEPAKKIAWLVQGADYETPGHAPNIFSNESTVYTGKISVEFTDNSLKRLSYNSEIKLDNFRLNENFREVDIVSGSTYSSNMMSQNRITADFFNYTYNIFDSNDLILNLVDFFDFVEENTINMTYSMNLFGYNHYFISNNDFGYINFSNLGECWEFESRYIDFYDQDNGISFVMQNKSEIDFCVEDEQTIDLSIRFPNQRFVQNYFILHNSTFNKTLIYQDFPKAEIGLPSSIKGMSLEKIDEIMGMDYDTLKSDLNVLKERDFSLEISNKALDKNYTYNPVKPISNSNVFRKDIDCLILDKFSHYQECDLIIKVW